MTDPHREPDGGGASRAETRPPDRIDIGPYHVVSVIGAGGMGRVFRAHDRKLNRDVALKLLPTEFASNPERLARFAREAQVLASLNHPHIGAIYGLEESEGRPVLVLELVEGPTLAERITVGPLTLTESLSIARQIADALEAAHSKGIVHRDLKPANLKLTAAGDVKVLDFGLAKTTAPEVAAATASQSPTMAGATRVGSVLGTAPYMSPEQARGLPVDARTDIWAFGCLLFEMLTGRKVFGADSHADSITRILERDPDWTALPRATPAPIVGLLKQCLHKNPGARPASMAAVREIIVAAVAPQGFAASRPVLAGSALAAVLMLAVGFYAWRAENRKPPTSSEWIQITRLDSATQPALSWDGRLVAFVRGPGTFVGPGQVFVKMLPDGEPVQLTRDDLPKMSPVFSPDGARIAYTVNDGDKWDTWEVAALRGEPHRWLRNVSGLTWLGPDDLLYSQVKAGIHMAIVRSNEARTNARDLYVPFHVAGMAHRSYASPDRTRVLVIEMNDRSQWTPCRLLNLDGSGPGQLVGPPNAQCTDAAWSPNGRWMYFTANTSDGFHLWRQRFPNGTPEQLTFGATEEQGIALSADGKSLITSVGVAQRSVWLHDASGERQVSLEGYAYFPLISADEKKIVYRVTRGVGSGQSPSELWVTDIASQRSQRLFPGQLVTSFDLSRDDRVVAAVRGDGGRSTIWLAWLDGREPPQPIPQADGDNPRFGAGADIMFRVAEGATGFVYRMKSDGTNRQRVFEASGTVFGSVSPDGRWLSNLVPRSRSGVSLFSADGQQPVLPSSTISRLRWTLDAKRAYLSIQYAQSSAFADGRTYVLPLARDSVLPRLPAGGFKDEAEIAALPGVERIPYGDVAVASTPGAFAYSRVTTTRNLFRIPLQ